MVKGLTNKPHEIGQSNRIRKLEERIDKLEKTIVRLTNRVKGIEDFKKSKSQK